MSNYGTYKDAKGLLPTDSTIIKQCIEVEKSKRKGMKIHCGHDFLDKKDTIEYGEVVHCKRCNQFFAKIKVMPWLTETCYNAFTTPLKKRKITYGSNHLATDCWIPVEVRITD